MDAPPRPLELPESSFCSERTFISGGERSLYELAVAAASLGVDVELRGAINRPVLEQLADAAGAAPAVGFDARRPDGSDLVVLPDAVDPDALTGALLSEAKVVIHLLAPPGLFGWSFLEGWHVPDPLTVPLDSIGTAETFGAIRDLGLTMWTNAHGIADAGRRAGAPVTWLGTGTPVPFPDPAEKSYDVAIVTKNRWSGWAEEVVDRLGDVTVLRIPPVGGTYSLAAHLAPARILVWPSRIEGMSRISRESRSVGTVPVAFNTNPFATADDHGGGVVLVDDLAQMAAETASLLADPPRLAQLAARARSSAAAQADWEPFVGRVRAAIQAAEQSPPASSRKAYAYLGTRMAGQLAQWEHANQIANAEVEALRREIDSLVAAETAARNQVDLAQAEMADIRSQLSRTEAELIGARAEISSYRSRLLNRLMDETPLGAAWRALKPKLRVLPKQ